VQPSGTKSFVAVAVAPGGKQVWATIGSTALLSIKKAREKAKEVLDKINAGEDRAKPQSFKAVCDEWLKRRVEAKGLRSATEIGVTKISPSSARPSGKAPVPSLRTRYWPFSAVCSIGTSLATRLIARRSSKGCVGAIHKSAPAPVS
jgi:hypothetical protein